MDNISTIPTKSISTLISQRRDSSNTLRTMFCVVNIVKPDFYWVWKCCVLAAILLNIQWKIYCFMQRSDDCSYLIILCILRYCYAVVYWSNRDKNQNGHGSSALWHRPVLTMDVYFIIGQDCMALRFDFQKRFDKKTIPIIFRNVWKIDWNCWNWILCIVNVKSIFFSIGNISE